MPNDTENLPDSTPLLEQEQSPSEMSRLTTKVVLKFLITVAVKGIRKFWALCSTCLLSLFLLYWLYGGLVTLTLVLVAILGFLYNIQDKLLYYPDQPAAARLFVDSPSILGLNFENHFVKTSDGVRINLVFVKAPVMSKAPTVIYFHGNAGNVGHRLSNTEGWVKASGCNVLLVEYRGYGKSSGTPSEAGLYRDAAAGLEFLLQRKDICPGRLVVFGRSLGGAVAVQLASSPQYARHVAALVLENTFTSLPDIARSVFDFRALSYVPLWFHKNKYPSRTLVRKIHVPTLFISGLADTLVPPGMMLELFNCSGSQLKRLARFEGGTHNETWQCITYHETINRFLQEVWQQKQNGSTSSTEVAYNMQVPFDDGATFTV